jgi:hypothetical protein
MSAYEKLLEAEGLVFQGIISAASKTVILFSDPQSRSTLGIYEWEFPVEAIRKRLAESRLAFQVTINPAMQGT